MTATPPDVPLSQLPTDEKARRASSFGQIADAYEDFRPGPPDAALAWILAEYPNSHVGSAVDLGAGTGACTRLLLNRADRVTAVEPDDRMRAILGTAVPGATALVGRGEAIPLPDASVDAVFASSSWHWMDPRAALTEVGRVLRPSGTLGVVWSGPNPEGVFIQQARALLEAAPSPANTSTTPGESTEQPEQNLADLVMADVDRPISTLEIPADGSVPFDQPEREVFQWDVALTADDLIGLLGTFSWIILMPDDTRTRVFAEARRILSEVLGVEGDVTVNVEYQADTWRARRQD
jgi:ubiquinone/menaquinone biosynthesis C-methylase UbiE